MIPFLSFYTPYFRRPRQLLACIESVQTQTIADAIEHRVFPDTTARGLGIDGMYARIPKHARALTGRYVHVLCDDDVLAAPDVVERVKAFAETEGEPPVIIVRSRKLHDYPFERGGPPVCGHIDLGCVITRRDLWLETVHAYGGRYEGDFDHVSALYRKVGDAGFRYCCDFLFMRGAVSRGRPEAA